MCCSDGTVYGCGSTEYGQLPYLKFTAGAAGTEPSQPQYMDTDGDSSRQARNEVTVPTKLNLQFLQQQSGKSAVVSSMVAGGYGSALLTRAPDELPDHRHTRLSDRSVGWGAVTLCACFVCTWAASARSSVFCACWFISNQLAVHARFLSVFLLT